MNDDNLGEIKTDGWNEIVGKGGVTIMAVGNSLVKDALEVADEVMPENAPHKIKILQ